MSKSNHLIEKLLIICETIRHTTIIEDFKAINDSSENFIECECMNVCDELKLFALLFPCCIAAGFSPVITCTTMLAASIRKKYIY